jgi:Leucine-rich repeat (LRR) protein
MYNQFTEIDQRPLNINKVVLDPMQIPRPGKRRKVKANSKNPYKIKKIRLLGEEAMRIKRLDGFGLLKLLRFEHPKEIIRADISYRRIVELNPDHLEYFSNLIELNCSENELRLEMLKKLPAVQTVDISHNRIRSFPLEMNGFRALRNLNLSFNAIEFEYLSHLAMMPELRHLNIGFNDLKELPEDMSNF